MKHTLDISSVRLLYDERLILSDVYLNIETGNIVGLLGRNGEGKSSLMRVIFGVIDTDRSIIIVESSVYEAYKHPKLMRYLPQHNFIPKYLTLKRIFKDFRIDYDGFVQKFSDFKDRQNSKIGDLSGGMRRLTELYVIIKSQTKFVLLDEPFTHISPIQANTIKAIIEEESSAKGFLITDHMYRNILKVCDQIYLILNGKTQLINNIDELKKFGYLKQD
ncbi:MAG: ATP-binding cassette domain-containing protein [Proteiniphilum sp.]